MGVQGAGRAVLVRGAAGVPRAGHGPQGTAAVNSTSHTFIDISRPAAHAHPSTPSRPITRHHDNPSLYASYAACADDRRALFVVVAFPPTACMQSFPFVWNTVWFAAYHNRG